MGGQVVGYAAADAVQIVKRALFYFGTCRLEKLLLFLSLDTTYLKKTVLGFGVCGETNDPKIVMVDRLEYHGMGSVTDIQVFTLSTGAWRNSYGNLPRESIDFVSSGGVVINGLFYWLAYDRNSMDGDRKYVIISFDMTSEEFGEITVPCNLSYAKIFKLRESLVVVDRHKYCDKYTGHDVWMMGDGVPKSFTKLFTFTTKKNEGIIGFRKNGEPIIDGGEELVVYDPSKKRFNSLGIEGSRRSFEVYDYMKTLLLDKPNFMVYNDF
ncbi:F-box/kelch-repeat protein At3g06240-like [Bidens hawaiensis]|uniref:F-box/kelch-repeat protein At3g06240-like n=1 Tax=Bidens hawaiensis TaxID=980011 RepID=UPI00404B7B99